jgi:hypothetical protein
MTERAPHHYRNPAKPVPLDVLIGRARAGGYRDLATAIGALRTVAARSDLSIDMIEDALADALENLLEARE